MPLFADALSKPYARLTGFFYLIIAVAGGFAIAYVPSVLIVPGDAAATANAIAGQAGLFHAGMMGEMVIMLAEIMATTMLYFMFRPVSSTLSMAAALARLSMVAVMAAMLFFSYLAFALATRAELRLALDPQQADALTLMFMQAHEFGIVIWQFFFTLHLALLGWLVMVSGCFPRLIGFGMLVGSGGYLLDSLMTLGLIGGPLAYLVYALLAVVTVSEVGFALWLLIRGQRVVAQPVTG